MTHFLGVLLFQYGQCLLYHFLHVFLISNQVSNVKNRLKVEQLANQPPTVKMLIQTISVEL